jgi:hypothetical protein
MFRDLPEGMTPFRGVMGRIASLWQALPLRPRRQHLASTAEMAAVLQLAARLNLARTAPRRPRALAMLDWICWPTVAALALRKIDARTLRAAAVQSGKSRVGYFLMAWRTCSRYGVRPDEYQKFALHQPQQARNLGDFLLIRESLGIYRQLFKHATQKDMLLIDEKADFIDFCRERQIPTAHLLAIVTKGGDQRT